MSSTLEDALAQLIISDAVTFASLPLPLAHRVFLALPPDARGRASCVCRAWCDVLADPWLWTSLDMSFMFVSERHFLSVLRGASGRARNQLFRLDLSQQDVPWDVLLPVLTTNAGSLRELHLQSLRGDGFDTTNHPTTVAAVLAAAPLLQVLAAEDVTCKWNDAPRMLRAEPPFALLQMRCELSVHFTHDNEHIVGGMERSGPFAAALVNAALHPALSQVHIWNVDTALPALMGALVDAALARRLRKLTMYFCTPPAAAPLARLLAEGSLDKFEISSVRGGAGTPLFVAAGAALVAGALRENTTLTKLDLWSAQLSVDMDAAGAFLGALVGHPSLRELRITSDSTTENCFEFGTALAALIAADARALHVLVCYLNHLGDGGLAPIVQALPFNRHLRELDMSHNGMSEAFARERLLPALRANKTLRKLRCAGSESGRGAANAVALVRRRWQHA